MRDEQRRDAELELDAANLGTHQHAQVSIEVRQRLVQQQDDRFLDERARQRHPLALAARELSRPPLQQPADVEQLGHLRDLLLGLSPRDFGQVEREADVLLDAEVRIDRVVLEDEADLPPLRRDVGDILLAEVERAGTGLRKAGHEAERGRLAATRGADDGDELAVGDLEIQVVDGGDGAELDGQSAYPDLHRARTAAPSPPWASRRRCRNPKTSSTGTRPTRLPAESSVQLTVFCSTITYFCSATV